MNKIINEKKVTLSARMQRIVEMLKQEAQTEGQIPCILDIGCDHAFISIACVKECVAKHVIAMDVRKGPLEIARSNIQSYGLEKSVETRLSDGFEQAKVGEASWAVIAGMGGALMCHILKNGRRHLDAGIGLILQPQSEPEVVRYLLSEEKYEIVDETFLQEDGKFYTIIKAKKADIRIQLNAAQAIYGPILIKNRDFLFLDYLNQEWEKKETLLNKLSEQDTESARLRCETLRQELLILREAGRR